jgi:hypothetical protein
MKQIAFILLLLLPFISCKEATQHDFLQYGSSAGFIETDEVWICDSPNAYAYHNNEYCSGFNRCNHSTALLPVFKIQKEYGNKYRKCKRCYKY